MKASETSLDRLFASRLASGERLLEVAIGAIRVRGQVAVGVLLHAVGAGMATLLFWFLQRFYLVGLTDRRVLLLGVQSASDLTIIEEYDLGRENVSFTEVPGSIRLSSAAFPGELEFAPLLLDGNRDRARAIGEALGSFESTKDAAAAGEGQFPTDVAPFAGLRRVRAVLVITSMLIVALALRLAFGFRGGVGAGCTDDSDCGARMFCSRKLHPGGVCTLACEVQADCPKGFRCSSSDKSCVEDR